jgi:cytochrome c553
MSPAWIDGSPVTLDAAAAEAARLLAASRLPVVAGLGTDIAGARAAIALARRLGGAVDHMHSGALLRDLDVMREAGMMVTTPNEARIRGDVLLLVGAGLLDAWPQLQQRLLAAPFLPGAKVADTPLVSSPPGSGRPAPGGASAQRREARGSVAEAVGEGDRVGVKRRVSFTPPRPPSPALRSAPAGHPPLPGEGGSKRRVCRLVSPPVLALLLLACASFAAAHAAGNVAAGKRKALQCQTCHGLDGLSKLPEAPHIAGQPEPYLVKSLNDYRKGTRTHDMMTLVVRDLTDQDVADLSAYYAAIEVTVKPPDIRPE